MKSISDVVVRLEQMDSLSLSLESAILEAQSSRLSPADKKAYNLLCLMQEQIGLARKEAEEVEGHFLVANAVVASAQMESLRTENERLKAELNKA